MKNAFWYQKKCIWNLEEMYPICNLLQFKCARKGIDWHRQNALCCWVLGLSAGCSPNFLQKILSSNYQTLQFFCLRVSQKIKIDISWNFLDFLMDDSKLWTARMFLVSFLVDKLSTSWSRRWVGDDCYKWWLGASAICTTVNQGWSFQCPGYGVGIGFGDHGEQDDALTQMRIWFTT